MSLDQRLSRLTPALTARQRFIALLQTHRAGQVPDPSLRATMPPDQAAEFAAYGRLLTASEVLVGAAAKVLHEHVDDLRSTLVRELALIKRHTGRRSPAWLRELDDELQALLAETVAHRWRELRVIERVWDDLQQQLDGADPAHPDARRRVAEAGTWLRALAQALPAGEALLTEPDEALVASLWAALREAYEVLGWTTLETLAGGKR